MNASLGILLFTFLVIFLSVIILCIASVIVIHIKQNKTTKIEKLHYSSHLIIVVVGSIYLCSELFKSWFL